MANYAIIAWGGAYDNVLKELESLQNRIIKIIKKSKKHIFQPLRIKDNFRIDSVMFHYNDWRKKFLDSKRVTRKKAFYCLKWISLLTLKII